MEEIKIRFKSDKIEQFTCLFCQKKATRRTEPIKGRSLPKGVLPSNRRTCSKKCAREYLRLTQGKSKSKKKEIQKILKNEKGKINNN